MTIDKSLLIAAPMLQDLLVGKDGLPLAAGVVTMYSDSQRTFLKNWYYQAGSFPSYNYLPLPNPLTLSAAGTICDVNGNDVIPFYYPYDVDDNNSADPYYITVYNSSGLLEFTRSNFPYNVSETDITSSLSSLQNYIVNNRFWRNIASLTVPDNSTWANGQYTTQYNSSGSVYYATLCPSQHDGFSMPDVVFIQNTNANSQSIQFQNFGAGSPTTLLIPSTKDIQPEYYIEHTTSTNNSGETLKVYQFPISLHLATLALQPATVTIEAINMDPSGISGSDEITIFIYQFAGTGSTSPSPIEIGVATLSTTWNKFTFTFQFPSSSGLTLSAASDDAFYLQIGMPLNVACNVAFCIPSLYLGTVIPYNYFQTYDQIDAIINSARTGDIRTSINNFYPFGWVPLNNGTIGNASSNASSRANADTWPLFNLIWTTFSFLSDPTDVVPILTSAGAPSTFGTSAIDDFNANKQLTLTKAMGVAILGGLPNRTANDQWGQSYSITGNTLVMSTTYQFFTGAPVILTNEGGSPPSGLAVNTIYYAILLSSTTISLATTYANALNGTVIVIGGAGTGNNAVFTATSGTSTGQYSHTQLRSELPDPITGTAIITSATAGGLPVIGSGSAYGSGVVSNQGGNNPFNIVQPSVFYNMFMKL